MTLIELLIPDLKAARFDRIAGRHNQKFAFATQRGQQQSRDRREMRRAQIYRLFQFNHVHEIGV